MAGRTCCDFPVTPRRIATMNPARPIRFDPQRRVANPLLKRRVDAFTFHLEAEERRLGIRARARRDNDRRNYRLAVEAIVCNLLVAAMVATEAQLSVPRGHAAMWGAGRYRTPVYGQHFVATLDLLNRLKLIEQVAKGFRFSERARQPTTIRSTRALASRLPLGNIKWTDFRSERDSEVIILKPEKDDDGQAVPIDYIDTRWTRRWRREVRAINVWLATAPISVLGDGEAKTRVDRDGQPIDPFRRSLHRTFNNADWKAGGRLFGGFWMTMERTERFRAIRIAGEEIVNVDYSSLFPRMAYVRAQAAQPEDDLYDISGDGTCRGGWKKLINALLFASRPLGAWPEDTRDEFPKGTKLKDALAAIKLKHSAIAPLFEQGFGFELMRHESDLLVSVVTALFKNGITALPLHDSVLIAKSHAGTAKDFMEREFMQRTGAPRAFVKVDFGPI